MGSIRLGRRSNHISVVSKIQKEDLMTVFREGGLDFIRMFKGRWCELISVDWYTNEEDWIHRALGGQQGISVKNKKILVLRKEGTPLHQYPITSACAVAGRSWCKIAIEDTETGDVIIRSIHNVPKETLDPSVAKRSFATTDGWFYFGGPKLGKPSTVGSDKTFWLDLATVIGLN